MTPRLIYYQKKKNDNEEIFTDTEFSGKMGYGFGFDVEELKADPDLVNYTAFESYHYFEYSFFLALELILVEKKIGAEKGLKNTIWRKDASETDAILTSRITFLDDSLRDLAKQKKKTNSPLLMADEADNADEPALEKKPKPIVINFTRIVPLTPGWGYDNPLAAEELPELPALTINFTKQKFKTPSMWDKTHTLSLADLILTWNNYPNWSVKREREANEIILTRNKEIEEVLGLRHPSVVPYGWQIAFNQKITAWKTALEQLGVLNEDIINSERVDFLRMTAQNQQILTNGDTGLANLFTTEGQIQPDNLKVYQDARRDLPLAREQINKLASGKKLNFGLGALTAGILVVLAMIIKKMIKRRKK